MSNRTKTYIAADWTGDQNLIFEIYKWKHSNHWSLDFVDAHELTQARDDSLPCSIKKSLAERLNVSKTFVLIVGNSTIRLNKGACWHCENYDSNTNKCTKGYWCDNRSYIDFECEKALRDGLRIVVIYNFATIHKQLCPEPLRYTGTHIKAYLRTTSGNFCLDYTDIKNAIMGIQ